MEELSQGARKAADEVIADVLTAKGVDYGAHRYDIANLFDNDLWEGNWDSTTDLDPASGLSDLRLIQEDEYDQSMGDEDKERLGEAVCYSAGHYVFFW